MFVSGEDCKTVEMVESAYHNIVNGFQRAFHHPCLNISCPDGRAQTKNENNFFVNREHFGDKSRANRYTMCVYIGIGKRREMNVKKN